jgi:hypothetical protein
MIVLRVERRGTARSFRPDDGIGSPTGFDPAAPVLQVTSDSPSAKQFALQIQLFSATQLAKARKWHAIDRVCRADADSQAVFP